MMKLIVLSLLFVSTVFSQENVDPACQHFQKRTLIDLLNNPPAVQNPNQLLECLPRKLIREFTEKEGPHVEITISCLENPHGGLCASKGPGYSIIAETLTTIFRDNTRCSNCNANHPNVELAVSLLQRRHPKQLQKGLRYLTAQH